MDGMGVCNLCTKLPAATMSLVDGDPRVSRVSAVVGLQRVFRLPDLWVRPTLGGKGRKVPGTLEAHQNGFRYVMHC